MRRIAVINQKGGVGKTTTAVNLGAALATVGKRVLLIDLDPQSHMSLHVGLDPAAGGQGIYEALSQSLPIADVRRPISENLWAVGSTIDLAAAEIELAGVVGREVILRDLLEADAEQYDYVIMDCPPSLGLLTLNALSAANEVFIPLQPHYLALHGLSRLLETVSLVARRINPVLKVTGVVVCMHEPGTRLATEVLDDVSSFLEAARGGKTPWAGARVFETIIRRNIKLAECPSYGQTIFTYGPNSHGATDYAVLAEEVVGMVKEIEPPPPPPQARPVRAVRPPAPEAATPPAPQAPVKARPRKRAEAEVATKTVEPAAAQAPPKPVRKAASKPPPDAEARPAPKPAPKASVKPPVALVETPPSPPIAPVAAPSAPVAEPQGLDLPEHEDKPKQSRRRRPAASSTEAVPAPPRSFAAAVDEACQNI